MDTINSEFKYFSDRFGGKSNRFHSIARIKAASTELPRLNKAIQDIFAASHISALRWADIDGAKERFAAQKLFEYALREMRAGVLHIEIEVWDTKSTPGIWQNTQSSPERAAPDDVEYAIDGPEQTKTKVLLFGDTVRDDDEHTHQRDAAENRSTPIRDISPLSQLAGLFAGLVSFSYEKRDEYAAWLRRSGPQCALYSNEVAEYLPSKVSVERFQVLRHFLDLCDSNGIAMSIEGARGLTTQGDSLLNDRTRSANESIDGSRLWSAAFERIRQPNRAPEPILSPLSAFAPLRISFKVN